jgi:hypothetical protein
MGHAPQFYVAGTLPEFSIPGSLYGGSYSSSSMPASAQFLRSYERDYDAQEPVARVSPIAPAAPAAVPSSSVPVPTRKPEEIAPRIAAQAEEKPQAARPHFSRTPAHARNRKPASSSTKGRVARGTSRSNGAHSNGSSRHAKPVRWAHGAAKNGHGNGNGNGHSKQNGSHANGARKSKPAAAPGLRNGHVANGKPAAKSSARPASRPAARPVSRTASRPVSRSAARRTPATRNDARTDARSRRKPALSASAKAGNRTRYGFTAPSRQRSKKRG